MSTRTRARSTNVAPDTIPSTNTNTMDDTRTSAKLHSNGVNAGATASAEESTHKQFKLKHQSLSINVDFDQKLLWGTTELICGVLDGNIDKFRINSRQCRLHRVTVNEIDAEVHYNNDPLQEIRPDVLEQGRPYPSRAYRHFHKDFTAAGLYPDAGEVTITIPPEVIPAAQEAAEAIVPVETKAKDKVTEKELFVLKVTIKFSLSDPTGGVYFVMPTNDLVKDRPQHVFTHNQTNSARLWFPCLDTWTDRVTWTLTFTVPPKMTAVSCGYLHNQELIKDKSKKKCEYRVPVPTPACDIGFVIGEFELYQDKAFPALTSFCLPGLSPQLKHTVSIMTRAFEFFTDYLGMKFPFRSYKQVFVENTYEEVSSFSSFSIFDTSLLHSKSVIEPTHEVRWKLVYSAARQYFGHYLTQKWWADTWLLMGMAGYVANVFMIKAHGVKENLLSMGQLMEEVCQEEEKGQAPLYNSEFAHPCELYSEFVRKKSLAIMWMIERRIGDDHFQRVLNNLLGMADAYKRNGEGSVLSISTHAFLRLVKKASGQELKVFADVWIYRAGCVRFHVNFKFNRKRSSIEFALRQTAIGLPPGTKFSGPVRIRVQEMDGYTTHDMHIEDTIHKQDFTCRSKFRRARKRKVRLPTGEETDIEFLDQADTPILFVRFDPEFFWLRQVVFEHEDLPADYMWIYQMQYDRDPYAQKLAIEALARFPSAYVHDAILDVVTNPEFFYQTRISAAKGLATHPRITVEENGVSHLNHNLKVGSQLWGWESLIWACKHMYFNTYQNGNQFVRQNDFSGLREYLVQKSIPLALSAARDLNGNVPLDVLEFILHMIDFNDNKYNLFSDNYYVMSNLDALAGALSPSAEQSNDIVDDKLLGRIVSTITRLQNMDMLIPSYRWCVTQGCLRVLTQLCLSDRFHIDNLLQLLTNLAQYGQFRALRVVAVECMAALSEQLKMQCVVFIVNCAEHDPDYGMRQIAIRTLRSSESFIRWAKGMSSWALVEKLWYMMNVHCRYDIYLRMEVMSLYKHIWGFNTPNSTRNRRRYDRKNLGGNQLTAGTSSTGSNIIRVRSLSRMKNRDEATPNDTTGTSGDGLHRKDTPTIISLVHGKRKLDVDGEFHSTPGNTGDGTHTHTHRHGHGEGEGPGTSATHEHAQENTLPQYSSHGAQASGSNSGSTILKFRRLSAGLVSGSGGGSGGSGGGSGGSSGSGEGKDKAQVGDGATADEHVGDTMDVVIGQGVGVDTDPSDHPTLAVGGRARASYRDGRSGADNHGAVNSSVDEGGVLEDQAQDTRRMDSSDRTTNGTTSQGGTILKFTRSSVESVSKSGGAASAGGGLAAGASREDGGGDDMEMGHGGGLREGLVGNGGAKSDTEGNEPQIDADCTPACAQEDDAAGETQYTEEEREIYAELEQGETRAGVPEASSPYTHTRGYENSQGQDSASNRRESSGKIVINRADLGVSMRYDGAGAGEGEAHSASDGSVGSHGNRPRAFDASEGAAAGSGYSAGEDGEVRENLKIKMSAPSLSGENSQRSERKKHKKRHKERHK